MTKLSQIKKNPESWKYFKQKLNLSLWKVDLIKKGKLKYIFSPVSKVMPIGTVSVNTGQLFIRITKRYLVRFEKKNQIVPADEGVEIPSTKEIIIGSGFEEFFYLYKDLTKGKETFVDLPIFKWLYVIEKEKKKPS